MKAIGITLFIIILTGCYPSPGENDKGVTLRKDISYGNFRIMEIDSCEYVYLVSDGDQFSHKGNCKYCIERNKNQ